MVIMTMDDKKKLFGTKRPMTLGLGMMYLQGESGDPKLTWTYLMP